MADCKKSLNIVIRRATPDDFPSLSVIINKAYRGTDSWTTEAHLVRGQRITVEELNKLRDPILVAEVPEENIIIGCISAEYWDVHTDMGLPEKSALLGLFAVDPNFQSAGVGSKLMRECVQMIKDYGCKTAVLWVINGRSDIISWYERQGFKWTGKVRDFVMPELLIDPEVYFKIFTKDI